MGKRKIKHLGRNKSVLNVKKLFQKILVIIGGVACIFAFINITKDLKGLYKGRNLTDNKIEFYIEVADEIGENKVQLSWKELLAIDMLRYDKDLSNIKKKDVIDVGKLFISKQKDDDGNKIYGVKTFDTVLDKLGFNEEQKNKAKEYLNDLENVALYSNKLIGQTDKINFVKNVSKGAKENYYKYGILPSITTAQAILESGWGQSSLTKSSNNIFGIKADSRWNGEKVQVSTSENYNDKIVASFRVYSSTDESINDHGKFLSENSRYRENGLFDAHHYTTQAQALENAGYSTKQDKNGELIYADTLIALIRNYNLQLLDRQVETVE